MGDLLSVARFVGSFIITMAAMPEGSHRTAIDNARTALAEAQRRSQERREVDAVFAALAAVSQPQVTTEGTPARTAAQ